MNTIIKRTKVRHTILIFLFLATVFVSGSPEPY